MGLALFASAFGPSQVAGAPVRVPARSQAHRAPSGPPLVTGSPLATGSPPGGAPEAEAAGSAPVSAGDPLVGNGLGSPLCAGEAGRLSGVGERNCRTSGFEAAPAPTGNYAFDVHIDTGVVGTNGDTLEQDYLISPLWLALVWVVHALVVAFEWSYTIDLLNSPAMSGVATGLRAAQRTFTEPWLAVVLPIASVAALYNGIVRRRVTETLGQALLMAAMMAGGLWVIMDPTGTVGSLGQWANQAGLGTLGAVAEGTPAHPRRTLADSMRVIFDAAVGAPWCYMEFGQVRWCEDPARIDPRLRATGQVLAAIEQAQIGCRPPSSPMFACAQPGSEQAQSLTHSAELLRDARTNGDLFLALGANQAARNSINEPGSLFRVLCGGSSEPCHGATAAQAEFRGRSGTPARMGGLLMIAIGALGMVLLLGFLALHLLGAAIVSLFYLSLAPVAVIAPALGDGGRAVFRNWGTRLLGAVAAKLIYSFLLGVVLMMGRTLMSLNALGWWTQWLLVSVLWWSAYKHRHRVLGFARGERESRREEHRQSLVRRFGRAFEAPRGMLRTVGRAKSKLSKPVPTLQRRRTLAAAGREHAKERGDGQVRRTLERDHAEASARVLAGPESQARLTAKREQLERVRAAQKRSLATGGRSTGERRRTARLGVRAGRIERELEAEQQRLTAARKGAADGERTRKLTGRVYTREQEQERARFLDAQAALPAGTGRTRGRGRDGSAAQATAPRRDYAAIAGLAGYGRAEYERLDPPRRRQARMEIDRELAVRRELGGAAEDLAAGGGEGLGRRERRKAAVGFERALGERVSAAGHRLPSSHSHESRIDAWLKDARRERQAPSSSVMDDARELAARRKRQLGRGRRER